MKHLNYFRMLLLCAFIGLSTTACNKDDGHIPMPKPEEAACRLEYIYSDKFNELDDDYENHRYSIKLSYNDKGYVTIIEDNEYQFKYFIKFTYNSQNQVISASSITNYPYPSDSYHNDSSYYEFDYTNGLLSSYSWYGGSSYDGVVNVIKRKILFQYDNKKRLIKIESSSFNNYNPGYSEDTIYYSSNYTYDYKDNLIKSEYFKGDNLIAFTTFEDYDNNPTPYAAVKGLPIAFGMLGFTQSTDLSKNNPGKVTVYPDTNQDGVFQADETQVTTYTYKYNSKGFPIELTSKSNNGYTETIPYIYNCK